MPELTISPVTGGQLVTKLTNNQMRDAVNRRQCFANTNATVYATNGSNLYTVYTWNNPDTVHSHGALYPLYLYDYETRTWFGNETKLSVTAQRHKTQTRPDGYIDWCSTPYLLSIIYHGSYAAHCAQAVTREGSVA